MTISDDADKTEKERIDIFYEMVKHRRDAGQLDKVQVHKELHVEAERLDVVTKAPLVLAVLLISANINAEVHKHRNLLLRFTHNNSKAQRNLMGGIEQKIALHSVKLMDKVAGILKLCYDNDLCPIEWVHFSGVSLMSKPKRKWFCPSRRGDRPNVMKPKAPFLKELERYNKE